MNMKYGTLDIAQMIRIGVPFIYQICLVLRIVIRRTSPFAVEGCASELKLSRKFAPFGDSVPTLIHRELVATSPS